MRIISCSNFAQSVLRPVAETRVHSVYSRTVNIICGGQLLSIQAQGAPLSPLSLETDLSAQELSALDVGKERLPIVTDDGICLGQNFLRYDFPAVWDCNLLSATSGLPVCINSQNVSFLQNCLHELMPVSGFADLLLPSGELWKKSAAAKQAASILDRFQSCIVSGDFEAAAESALALVGLGEGLTPSGDDFLCGMLAGALLKGTCEATAFFSHLSQKLRGVLDKTNDISAAFLSCAIEGLFSRAIIELAGGADFQTVSQSFAAIGHSSGADTLSGITFFAGCFQDMKKGGK